MAKKSISWYFKVYTALHDKERKEKNGSEDQKGSSTRHIMEGARADDPIYRSNDEVFQVDTVVNATVPESQGLKPCAVNHTFVRGPRQEDRLDAGASTRKS
ncbi:uncharacterized protein [Triticum aestivum]|uniref:uncharacterized protein isoform X1 n=1 Tax=Triticum aestivum TaxID=4565 RepID=UPI001D002138|nr:uncharacterized protein LOC123093739 isoform X1 [Triticum aestivum]